MSEPRAVLALIALACGLWAPRAMAQTPDPLANVRRATVAANAELELARAAWRVDSARRSTLTVLGVFGGVTVRTDSTPLASAVGQDLGLVLEQLRSELGLVLGPRADSMLARSSMSVLYDPPSSRWRYRSEGASVRLNLDGSVSSRFFNERGARDRLAMRTWLEAASRDAVAADAGDALRPWPNAAPGLRPWRADEREVVYRSLRLNRSPVAQACHDGSMAACRVALALGPADRDTVALWYDPALQRALIASRGRDTIMARALGPLHRACVQGGADQICRDMLIGAGVRAPLGLLPRAELLRLALVTGGTGAYARLRAVPNGLSAEALESISGVPTDSLLRLLHREVLQGRPASPAPDARTYFVASAWVVLSLAVVRRRRIAP
jgi:hypothetical protein